jgi:profilin
LSAAEVQEVISAYSNSAHVLAHGIHINGVKYFVIKADERSIYGKKVKEKEGYSSRK